MDKTRRIQEGPHRPAHARGGGGPPPPRLRLPRSPDVRSLPHVRRLPPGRPGKIPARIPLAPPPRHRDDHLHDPRQRRTRRQHGQQRRHRRGRRPVDDGRQRHRPPGDAQGRGRRPDGRLPALGQPARLAEDDGPALPRREEGGHPRGRAPRRGHGPRHLRHGRRGARPGPGHRHRPRIHRRRHAARGPSSSTRPSPATRSSPTSSRARAASRTSRASPPTTSSRPAISTSSGRRSRATMRSFSSATGAGCGWPPPARPSGSSSSRAGRSASPWPGRAPSS